MIFFDFFLYISFQLLSFYKYAIIIYVIISMLISFNIINTNSQFISIIMNFLFRLIEPVLSVIRKFTPNFGSIDIAPVVLIILIEGLQFIITKYGFM